MRLRNLRIVLGWFTAILTSALAAQSLPSIIANTHAGAVEDFERQDNLGRRGTVTSTDSLNVFVPASTS